MRALTRSLLGAGLGLLLAGAGCAASGTSCTDKGGTCNPGTVCPSGTETVTPAQFAAAGSDSYRCVAADDAGEDVSICCLPIPTSN